MGTFVLDGRTPLNANVLLIFLIELLILLNYIAVKIDKIDKQSSLLAGRQAAYPAETLVSCTKGQHSYLCIRRWIALTRHHPRPASTHSFSRTAHTPATMFSNFCRAAQRAVWLSPQSGAKESLSAGAYSKHASTRAAMSSAVSM